MSLDNPTKLERAIEFLTSGTPHRRVIVWAILALVLLGIVLFGANTFSTWNNKRKLNNALTEANVAMKELANAKAAVNPYAEAAALEKLKEATNTAIEASAGTDAAKAETNAAMANYKMAMNANRPVGTSENDLLRKLQELDQ